MTTAQRIFGALIIVIVVGCGLPMKAATNQAAPDIEISELQKRGKPPVARVQAPPQYPYEMSRAGIRGLVRIEYVIDERGEVVNARAIESNNPAFERPALIAAGRWKFQPGQLEGRAVRTRVSQLIEFNLEPVGSGRAPEAWKVTKGKDHNKQPEGFRWETPPIPKQTRFPVYPFEQLKAGSGGTARISYVVGPTGRVVATKLREASSPEYGGALLAMIEAWQFEPAKKKDGTPCYANLNAEYMFKPSGKGDVPVAAEARQILAALEKEPESIVAPEELDKPLKPIMHAAAVYPTSADPALGGMAEVEFFVDTNGDAQLPRIISSTAPEFGHAGVQALTTWRFEPPTKAGKPVTVKVRLPVRFPGFVESKPAK